MRYTHFGEGGYAETEDAIRALLEEAGRAPGAVREPPRTESADIGVGTPETYLGAARADGFADPPEPGLRAYEAPDETLPPSGFALDGSWEVGEESATAAGAAEIRARPVARDVYLVMSSPDGRPRRVEVLLDGEPVPAQAAGADVHYGALTVREERLYRLVSLPEAGEFELTLRVAPGVSAYAFTFG